MGCQDAPCAVPALLLPEAAGGALPPAGLHASRAALPAHPGAMQYKYPLAASVCGVIYLAGRISYFLGGSAWVPLAGQGIRRLLRVHRSRGWLPALAACQWGQACAAP